LTGKFQAQDVYWTQKNITVLGPRIRKAVSAKKKWVMRKIIYKKKDDVGGGRT